MYCKTYCLQHTNVDSNTNTDPNCLTITIEDPNRLPHTNALSIDISVYLSNNVYVKVSLFDDATLSVVLILVVQDPNKLTDIHAHNLDVSVSNADCLSHVFSVPNPNCHLWSNYHKHSDTN